MGDIMNAKQGCWTIPQLMANLEARVAELEATNKPVYVHHINFAADGISVINIDIINNTNEPFTSVTLMEHLLALPTSTRLMCTGSSSQDIGIVSLTNNEDVIRADLQDTDSIDIADIGNFADYVEAIRS